MSLDCAAERRTALEADRLRDVGDSQLAAQQERACALDAKPAYAGIRCLAEDGTKRRDEMTRGVIGHQRQTRDIQVMMSAGADVVANALQAKKYGLLARRRGTGAARNHRCETGLQ